MRTNYACLAHPKCVCVLIKIVIILLYTFYYYLLKHLISLSLSLSLSLSFINIEANLLKMIKYLQPTYFRHAFLISHNFPNPKKEQGGNKSILYDLILPRCHLLLHTSRKLLGCRTS